MKKLPNVIAIEMLLQIHYMDEFVLQDGPKYAKTLEWLRYHDLINYDDATPPEITVVGWEHIEQIQRQVSVT